MKSLNPEMIVLAREIRGISQSELADLIQLTQGMLSKIEKGLFKPSEEIFTNICNILEFPMSFFEQTNNIFEPNLSYYRKRIVIKKRDLLKAEGSMNLVRMNLENLMTSVELPELNLPFWDVDVHGTPESAAKWVRQKWRIPKGRIENLTKIIEDNGIVVVPFDFGSEKMDGLSLFTKERQPIIYINNKMPGDRQRLTLAHELGHLVMHIGQQIAQIRNVEKEAMQFAAEFLVPASEFLQDIETIGLETLGNMKRYWKISMGALLYRAKELAQVTENQYRYLWQQMAYLGYKTKEPAELSVPAEKATLFKEMLELHVNELGYTKDELAGMLHIKLNDLNALYYNDNVKLKIIRN
jgi:Zn-dependent peptidase ImmA (M78 family)/DNA-binding XRE family transcriptional regulator